MYSQEQYRTKLQNLIFELEEKLIEREEVIRLILLVIFAKHHAFLIGLPGVAKTRLLKIIAGAIEDGSFWEILMTKETKEKHLLGEDIEEDSVDKILKVLNHSAIADFQQKTIQHPIKTIMSFFKVGENLKTSDNIEEVRKEMSMLTHPFVLFDEMFKAGDDLLVACLPMLNERYYTSKGKAIPVPLNSLFSASNELPTGEKIEPFVDRLLVWYEVKRIQKPENFIRYIQNKFDSSKETKVKFSMQEIEYAHVMANDVEIPENIQNLYTRLEANIYKDGIRVSNRKFGPEYIIRALKVCAWLNGRNYINESDLLLIRHMAWQNFLEKGRLEIVVHDTIFKNQAQTENYINQVFKGYEEAKSFYQAELEATVSFMMDFFGAEGYKAYSLFMDNLVTYIEATEGHLSNMQSVYELYEYFLSIEKQINENIFLATYTPRTFENKKMLESVEIFIHERTAELEKLKDWAISNKDMSDYQRNRHKILKATVV